jgi:hypothetical protein
VVRQKQQAGRQRPQAAVDSPPAPPAIASGLLQPSGSASATVSQSGIWVEEAGAGSGARDGSGGSGGSGCQSSNSQPDVTGIIASIKVLRATQAGGGGRGRGGGGSGGGSQEGTAIATISATPPTAAEQAQHSGLLAAQHAVKARILALQQASPAQGSSGARPAGAGSAAPASQAAGLADVQDGVQKRIALLSAGMH